MRNWHKSYQYILFIFAFLITPCWAKDKPSVQSSTRGVTVVPQKPQDIIPISGEYWALIIAIDNYKNLPPLHSATRDAWALRDVLHDRYGFSDNRIKMLVDAEATRSNIEGALIQMGKKTQPDDSVLIYFAGHGEYNDDNTLGWWVPVDADPENPGTYILDAVVRNYVRSMQAQHVYLVADSCFSGNLFASNRSPAPISEKFYSKLQAKRSRWGFTSGNLEPVGDDGLNGHSVFAYYFIKYLKENTSLYVVPSEIASHVIPLVANNSAQLPRSQPLQGANHEGGQLVLRLTEALVNALEENRRLEIEVAKKEDDGKEQLMAKIESLVGAVNRLTGENEQSELKQQLQKEIGQEYQKKFEQQLEEQRQQEAKIRTRLQDLEAELAEARKENTLTSQEETQLQNQLQQQEGLLKQVEQERQDRLALKKQLEEQQREEAKVRARLKDLEGQLAAAQKGNTSNSSEEIRLRNQLQQQEELLRQVEQERQDRLTLQAELEKQRESRLALQAELEEQTRQQLEFQRLLEKERTARLEAEKEIETSSQKSIQAESRSQKSEPEKFDYFFGGGF